LEPFVDRSHVLPTRISPVAPSFGANGASPRPGTDPLHSNTRRQSVQLKAPPIVPLVAALIIGIIIDRLVEPCGTRTWIEVAIVSVTIAALAIPRKLVFTAALLVALTSVGGAWHHYRWSDLAPDDLAWSVTETAIPAWVRGHVRETLGVRSSDGFGAGAGDLPQVTTRFLLDLTEISDGKSWRTIAGRVIVIVAGDRRDIEAGQMAEAAGQLSLVAGPMNPGEFDYRTYLRAQGVRLRLTIDDSASLWRRPGAEQPSLATLLGRVRAWSRRRLVDGLDSSIAPLAAALLLGQREGIDPEVNDAFARTGTTHLLAISGLQLQALAGALLLLFRGFGLSRRPAYVIVGLAMAGYALVVGPAPSVIRATIMTTAFCLAAIVGRLDRPANTMALAGLGTLALNPSYLFDIGCQLSFLAIATLIWLVRPACALARNLHERIRRRLIRPRSPLDALERRLEPPWRHWVRLAATKMADGVIASAVVWLVALPLVALTFHLVSPIGILLNIPLIPLTTLALLLSGLSLVLSSIWLPLGAPLAWAAGLFLKLTKAIVLWGVGQTWGHRFVVGPAVGWVLVFYALLGVAAVALVRSAQHTETRRSGWFGSARPWWLLGSWSAIGWLLTAGISFRPLAPSADLLAVGHGLAIVILTPDGRNLLYDCGRLGDPSAGRRIIAPALWARGVRRIDTVFLSHADEDHYNGLTDLLDRFPIGEVRAPAGFASESNAGASRLIDLVRSRGIAVRPIAAPESWEAAGVRFTVNHPPAGWHPETPDNARSLVLDVAFAGHHLLLTGDLEQLGLIELLAQKSPDPPPDVLLSPHHGGKSANPEWLYQWARPRAVVVSQRRSQPGSSDTLSFVERMGIPVFRTGRQGSIRLDWSADGIVASGFLEAAGSNRKPGGRAVWESGSWVLPAGWPGFGKVTLLWWPRAVWFLAGILGFALGAVLSLIVAVTEIGAWALVSPRRSIKRISEPDLARNTAGGERTGEPLTARSVDGVVLAARWFPAAGASVTGKTLLLLHGFAESSSDVEAHRTAVLNQHGWNVASIDLRGFGESGGAYATFGAREGEDMRIWIDVLAERVSRNGCGSCLQPALWGRSMGAAIALRAASLDARIVALVLESPMVDITASTAAVLRRRRLPFANFLARLVIGRAGRIAGMRIDRPAPIESAAKAQCKAMIVHGTEDDLVPIDDARRLADVFNSPPRWLDVPGATHADVVEKGADALLFQIMEFLDDAVSGEAASPAINSAASERGQE
jgi:competence protein ComEC